MEVEDEEFDNSQPRPMVEMSQDYMIEWDESNNIDLRQMIAKSPHLATPASSTTTRSTRSSSGAGSTETLEDVRRRLLEGSSTPKLHTQPLSLEKSSKSTRTRTSSSSSSKHDPQLEQEIDGIFSMLQEEEQRIDGHSPCSAPTQRLENRTSRRVTNDVLPPTNKTTMTTSLASRHRRRRREVDHHDGHRKKRHVVVSKKDSSFSSPKPTGPPVVLTAADDDGRGEFEELLKQLRTTPQSIERKRPPLQNIDKNVLPSPAPSNQIMLKGPSKGLAEQSNNVVQGKPTFSSHQKQPDTALSSHQPANVQSRPPLPKPSNAPITQPARPTCPVAHQISRSAPNQQTGYQRVILPKPIDAKENTSKSTSNPKSQPVPTGQQPTSIHTSSTSAVTKANTSNNISIPPPAAAAAAAVSNIVSTSNADDDDEFGDFDLSFDDMANLDSLLSIKSSQLAMQPKEPNPAPKPTNPLPEVPQSEAKPATIVDTANSNVIVEKVEPQDEFGDFPDIDFDALDQQIAQRSSQSSLPSQAALGMKGPAHHAQPIYATPATLIVTNPTSTTTDTAVTHTNCSRYKVLNVVDDTNTYTRTLSVARWAQSMLSDYDDEKGIHRNSHVTLSDDENHGSMDAPARRKVEYTQDGYLHLRGEWYHTRVSPGDDVHLCSLSGSYRTDAQALPIILHSNPPNGSVVDDLVLITHPDMLVTPTTVSENVSCSRRAVLKSRVGSSGFSSEAPLIGTMRHELFGLCLKEQNFDEEYVKRNVQKIVRQHSEALLGCGISSVEAERKVCNVLPVIKRFVKEYTTMLKDPNAKKSPQQVVEGHGAQTDIRFLARSVYSIEEPVISHELALKGNVDAILETMTETLNNKKITQNHLQPIGSQQHSLMSLELKTGHNQKTQHAHMAQLALYTLMLQIRHGTQVQHSTISGPGVPDVASTGGILLYLNHESLASVHVAPLLHEIKSLIGQRNVVASELVRASRPRGIALSYDDKPGEDEKDVQRVRLLPAPAAALPQVMPNSYSCTRCYANRECMLYAAIEHDAADPSSAVRQSHNELLSKFTGQLKDDDLAYFRDWDRLVDLEADAGKSSVARPWLVDSCDREKEKGESVSALVYDRGEPSDGSRLLIAFRRSAQSQLKASLDSLSLSKGCRVIVSTDGTSLESSQSESTAPNSKLHRTRSRFKHQMHVIRGTLERVDADGLFVSAGRDDLDRVRGLVARHRNLSVNSSDSGSSQLLFRMDKDNSSFGIGTLRQNLIKLFTADYARKEGEEFSKTDLAKRRLLPWLRDVVVRLQPPSFDAKPQESFFNCPSSSIPGCDMRQLSSEFSHLNSDQQNAVAKVMNARDYTLIQGLPGTGKTSTLSFIARLLAACGKRVLITSYTHAAVDNVVLKLMEKGLADTDASTGLPNLVRVGQSSSCHDGVRHLLAGELAKYLDKLMVLSQDKDRHSCLSQSESFHLENPSAQSLQQVMSSARIVCVTALSVPRSPLLLHETFDVVIVDEAGQISQPAILGALMAADSFVLVGDHKQLPPLVNSEVAEAGGYGVSMLKRLAERHPESIAPLTYQYRMNKDICRLSSEAVYGGRLKCGNNEVGSQLLAIPSFPSCLPQAVSRAVYSWLKVVIDPQKPVIFVDTDNIKKDPRPVNKLNSVNQGSSQQEGMEALETNIGGRVGGNVVNPTEATLIRFILKGLFTSGVPPSSVGVISPFRAQLRILEDDATIASWMKEGLELSTIDRYQGRDKPVIILSFVRSNPRGKAGRLLQDMRRLNVAMTRAKCKLIIVGSFSTLKSGSDPLRPVLGRINKRGQRFLLPENAAQCYKIP